MFINFIVKIVFGPKFPQYYKREFMPLKDVLNLTRTEGTKGDCHQLTGYLWHKQQNRMELPKVLLL